MKQKTKLIATFMAMCLVVSFAVIGILAVKSLNMSVGGNITFTTDGIVADISQGKLYNSSGTQYADSDVYKTGSSSTKMQPISITNDKKESEYTSLLSTWSTLDLKFNGQGEDVVIKFRITNKMSNDELGVAVTLSEGTDANSNIEVSVTPTTTQPIPSGGTSYRDYSITFHITDTSINASLVGFNISFALSKSKALAPSEVMKPAYLASDGTIKDTGTLQQLSYYYVEMGTYNNKPVKWRYVSSDGVTAFNPKNGLPSSVNGYYILETAITEEVYFGLGIPVDEGYICNADYAFSDIRQYIQTSLLTLLNIDEEDPIYKKIQKRTLEDLYSDIWYEGNTTIPESAWENFAYIVGQEKFLEEDKLWIPSIAELTNWLCGGTWDKTSAKWGRDYWTRTTLGYSMSYEVMQDGSIKQEEGYDCEAGIRPCFKIG